MSEMQQTADRLIVIGRGRLIADATTAELLSGLGWPAGASADVPAGGAG
jgi:ABC-type multidrug transport system ATPase subunit